MTTSCLSGFIPRYAYALFLLETASIYTVISDKAWTDQKSASSKPLSRSHMDLALRKKSSALSIFAERSLWMITSCLVPGFGLAKSKPRARTRKRWHKKKLSADSGSL